LGNSLAVDLEMVNDTRYRAERWIAQNVEPQEYIGVFSPPQYLPRFFVAGRRAQLMEMKQDSIRKTAPPFILLTSHNYQDFDEDQRKWMRALVAGELGYAAEPVAEFSSLYLPPQRHWIALAGWGTRGAGKVSPHIFILKRTAG